MKNKYLRGFAALCLSLFLMPLAGRAQSVTVNPPDGVCEFSSLDLTPITCFDDNGKTKVRANLTTLGEPIVIRDTLYTSGVGTHAPSKAVIKLNGAKSFHTRLAVDDGAQTDTGHGIVDYTISTYKNKVSTTVMSGTLYRTSTGSTPVDLDLTNCDYLVLDLAIGEQAWADHVCYGNAYFTVDGTNPEVIAESQMYADGSKTVNIPAAEAGTENIPLSSLEIENATCGWGTIQANKTIDGNAITLRDTVYTSGVGTHAPGKIIIKLNGSVTRFYTRVGVDDEVASSATSTYGICTYRVTLQGQSGDTKVVSEGTISALDKTTPEIDVDVNGWKYVILENENGAGGNSYDHVDWANAYLVFQDQNSTRPAIVTEESLSGGLACATTVFSQPGVRFMHKIKAADSSAELSVSGLPTGLNWNATRHIVEGTVDEEGVYHYTIHVTQDGDTKDSDVTFTVSKNLELPTPFMGWQSWNAVQNEVSLDIVKTMADFFEESGLYDAGWNVIGLDDWWHASARNSDGTPAANSDRFPGGMGKAAEYVHNKGMKLSIYTDVANYTCAGAFGSYGSEEVDAKTYAQWGVDCVKTDYCHAPSDVETCRSRYKTWADALHADGRNINLFVCEWGVREPWKWGAESGGCSWRISQDVRDCWIGSGSGVGVTQSINVMKDLSVWQGVNRFNDADMLCTGLHGTGKSSNDLCQTGPGMTQDEYRTQFALWCMWSSPMLLSFDPRTFKSNYYYEDDMKMLLNKELIALNQDPMGQQADLISENNNLVIFAKDLENGDVALSVTNLGSSSATATFDFSVIPALETGKTYTCRDLWDERDLDNVADSFTATVKSHATRVFRLSGQTGTGISSASSDNGKMEVKPLRDKLCVSGCGAKGLTKRVLLSDACGRVVAQATSNSDEVTLRRPSTPGVYVVNVVCDAKAHAAKVAL